MDSLPPELLDYYASQPVVIQRYPADKDYTDTQLALNLLEDLGAEAITLLGAIGSRWDHSWSNIFSSLPLVRKGIKLIYIAPRLKIYLLYQSRLEITAAEGDIVSLFPLTEQAGGITTSGLVYPLQDAVLYHDRPYGVSNCFTGEKAAVEVKAGVLAVMQLGET
jgi:thiamine pyrophosphokinase